MKNVIKALKSLPKPTRNRRVFIAYLVVFALFAIPITAYSLRPDKPVDIGKNEVNDILKKVGLLMDIPAEIPTVITISDASKLRGQQFFANAQNNDKVLIFSLSQKAVLYRPSVNKIIEVALYKPPVANTAKGEVAGAVATPAATAVPTKAFSLQDLIGDRSTPVPTITPSLAPTQVPQTGILTPTPGL